MEEYWMKPIYDYFLESNDYNGIPFENLFSEWDTTWEEGIRRLIILVEREECVIQSSSLPFIIRTAVPTSESTIKYLNKIVGGKSSEFSQFSECAFPSHSYLVEHRNISELAPYDKFLALGGAHLQPICFDMGVLNNYLDDPRYQLKLKDYHGSLSYEIPEDTKLDKKGYYELNSFGLGYDNNGIRVVVAYPRYLRNLSRSQQNHWEAYEKTSPCKVIKAYLDNTLEGCFAFPQSIASGILNERTYINKLWKAIFEENLFLKDYVIEDLPPYYSFLFRPTTKDLNRFYLILDKLISDNLNITHLKNLLLNGYDNLPPHKYKVDEKIGSLAALELWIDNVYTLKDGTKIGKEIVLPLKQVRKRRQPEAHKIISENTLDPEIYKIQDDILYAVYDSFCKLRIILSSHPKAIGITPPVLWSDSVYLI